MENEQAKFDLARHITTLTSALIVLIATVVVEVHLPIDKIWLSIAAVSVGLALALALGLSVLQMFLLSVGKVKSKAGEWSVFSFIYALTLICIFSFAGLVGTSNPLAKLFSSEYRSSSDPELVELEKQAENRGLIKRQRESDSAVLIEIESFTEAYKDVLRQIIAEADEQQEQLKQSNEESNSIENQKLESNDDKRSEQ